MPNVDISSGTLYNPPIHVGDQFQFTTSATGNIAVHTPVGEPWFSPSPANVVNGTVTVTAEEASVGLGWGYTVTGMQVSNNNPHVPVSPAAAHAKAS